MNLVVGPNRTGLCHITRFGCVDAYQVSDTLPVLGVLTHVVTVTFFAGYVAGGGPITWWHLTEW